VRAPWVSGLHKNLFYDNFNRVIVDTVSYCFIDVSELLTVLDNCNNLMCPELSIA